MLLLGASLVRAQKVMPTLIGTKYMLTMGPMTFQATAKNSGRVQSLQYAGLEVLHQDTTVTTQYGSTFWPSPQAVWNWPPPTSLDGVNDTVGIGKDSTITMLGSTDNVYTHVRIHKTFWADLGDSSFNLHYTLINAGTSRPWAPWEDTRIDTGGLYLFPKGTDTITGALAGKTTTSGGIVWFVDNNANVQSTGTNKFYSDGSQGWYAHINAARRLLFLKKFTDTPASKKAPSPEDEIEFWTTPSPLTNSSFIEMEVQGPYDTIPANDSVSWDMKWFVRKIPDTLTIAAGNQAIVDYIHQVLATPTAIRPVSSASNFSLRYTDRDVHLVLEQAATVSLALINSNGREISRLYSGRLTAGHHDFRFAEALPKGVYWLVLKNPPLTQAMSVKMLVLD